MRERCISVPRPTYLCTQPWRQWRRRESEDLWRRSLPNFAHQHYFSILRLPPSDPSFFLSSPVCVCVSTRKKFTSYFFAQQSIPRTFHLFSASVFFSGRKSYPNGKSHVLTCESGFYEVLMGPFFRGGGKEN